MSIISNEMRFLGVNSSLVNLIEKKDSTNNEKTEYYSLDDIRGYKVYTALLTQSGTDAPVATVLENTLGVITLQRNELGDYSILSDNLFLDGKTFMPQSFSFDAEQSVIPYADDSSINGHYSFWKTSEGDIKIFMYNNTGTFVEWSTALGTSFELPIEIRVYN